jgi:tRNA A-37 threonylcarbamoyl transferase component Bud32
LEDSRAKRIFLQEAAMQKRFAAAGLAPPVYRVGMFKKGRVNYGLLEMGLVDGTLDDLLEKRQPRATLDWVLSSIDGLINGMCDAGLIHGDFHFGNIGVMRWEDGMSLTLIDFGLSCCLRPTKCNPRLEYMQVLRSVRLSGVSRANEEYLIDQLLALYRKRFNPKLRGTQAALDQEWREVSAPYYRKVMSKAA